MNDLPIFETAVWLAFINFLWCVANKEELYELVFI